MARDCLPSRLRAGWGQQRSHARCHSLLPHCLFQRFQKVGAFGRRKIARDFDRSIRLAQSDAPQPIVGIALAFDLDRALWQRRLRYEHVPAKSRHNNLAVFDVDALLPAQPALKDEQQRQQRSRCEEQIGSDDPKTKRDIDSVKHGGDRNDPCAQPSVGLTVEALPRRDHGVEAGMASPVVLEALQRAGSQCGQFDRPGQSAPT